MMSELRFVKYLSISLVFLIETSSKTPLGIKNPRSLFLNKEYGPLDYHES